MPNHKVVDMSGNPIDTKNLSSVEAAEWLMSSIAQATNRWREGMKIMPKAFRYARPKDTNGAQMDISGILRRIRMDLEYIERSLK